MAIVGVHTLLYSSEPEALRAVLRDVFGWRHVDDGDGWLIFALPPAEMGIHPTEGPGYEAGGVGHQIALMCDDIHATVEELRAHGLVVDGDPVDEGFGVTTTVVLPGDVRLMLYEPRHSSPLDLRG